MATDVLSAEETRVADLTDQLIAQNPPASTSAIAFLGAQFDLGLAWVHFPVGHGGLDLSPKFQKIVNEKIARAGGPNSYARNPIGYGMCGPTVVEWGTDEQKRRYLRPLFTGEEIWCQLFSEPGSGSDFAGLSAKGVKDGEEWIVNGQKVWTTLAHLSKWGLLVVRTDAEAVKHAGLTAVVVDMHGPGVEVRPLRQMTGEAEFNEVYMTDARVPDSQRVGDVGDGWLRVLGATENNLQNIDAAFPVACFTCVTGVSGSGKSTLVNDILRVALERDLHRAAFARGVAGETERVVPPLGLAAQPHALVAQCPARHP